MRRFLVTVSALFICILAFCQEEPDVIGEMNDDFAEMKLFTESESYKSVHMIGAKYSYHLATASCTPDIGTGYMTSDRNFSVMYTYYNSMWSTLPYFGLTTGLKLGTEGFTSSKTSYGFSYEILEMPVISEFHIDFSHFRVLAGIGGYFGYKTKTDKPDGFDEYDIRYDYGLEAEAGFAVVFKPFELQIKGEYKYSLCSNFHTNKFSDIYWMFCYPRTIMLSCGHYFHLW